MGNRKLFSNVNAILEITKKTNEHLKFKLRGSGGSYSFDCGVVVFKSTDTPYAVIISGKSLLLLSSGAENVTVKIPPVIYQSGKQQTKYIQFEERGVLYLIIDGCKKCLGEAMAGGVYYLFGCTLSFFGKDGNFCQRQYAKIAPNELDNDFVICKNFGNESSGYFVYRVVDNFLYPAKAYLIKVKWGGRKFVLNFIPEKGCFERIELDCPSRVKRAEKLFDKTCFCHRSPGIIREFFAPPTLKERLEDMWEAAGILWDRFYIWLRTGSDVSATVNSNKL